MREINGGVDSCARARASEARGNGCPTVVLKTGYPICRDLPIHVAPAGINDGRHTIITGINLIIADIIIAVGLLYGRGEAFRG